MSLFCRWIAWLLLGAVALSTLCPIELRPGTGAPADLERAAAFALIGGMFYLGYPKHRLTAILLVIGLAGLLEAAQTFVPGRHGHMHDLLVKVFSTAAGGLLVELLRRSVGQALSPRFERS